MRHPEARALVDAYDGSAKEMVEEKLAACADSGDVDEALNLDQVRREFETVYEVEGQ